LCLTSAQKELVQNCADSLRANKRANELLFQEGEDFGDKVYNELPIYWEEEIIVDDETVVLPCKGLLDRVKESVSNKHVHLIDLKTTSKPVAKFNSSFEYWRYYRQMAWYLRALSAWLIKKYGEEEARTWKVSVTMVVVESYGLHQTMVYDVDSAWTDRGSAEAQDLVGRIAYATVKDNWEQSIEEIQGNGVIRLKPEEDVG